MIDVVGSKKIIFFELKKADLIFNALHGGEGENGIIQSFLEKNKLNLPDLILVLQYCINKHLTKKVARVMEYLPKLAAFKINKI